MENRLDRLIKEEGRREEDNSCCTHLSLPPGGQASAAFWPTG